MQEKGQGAEPGFWAALFDTSFTVFVTGKLVRFAYVLTMLLCGLLVLAGLSATPKYGVSALLLSIGLAFLMLILLRVYFETVISVFRIADHTRDTSKHTAALAQRESGQGRGVAGGPAPPVAH